MGSSFWKSFESSATSASTKRINQATDHFLSEKFKDDSSERQLDRTVKMWDKYNKHEIFKDNLLQAGLNNKGEIVLHATNLQKVEQQNATLLGTKLRNERTQQVIDNNKNGGANEGTAFTGLMKKFKDAKHPDELGDPSDVARGIGVLVDKKNMTKSQGEKAWNTYKKFLGHDPYPPRNKKEAQHQEANVKATGAGAQSFTDSDEEAKLWIEQNPGVQADEMSRRMGL
jgi:hypothetical protein